MLGPAATLLRLVLVAGVLFTTWSVVRLEPWTSVAAAPEPNPDIPWSNVNPIGVNTFLAEEVEVWKRERTMEMVAELGAGWIRQGFHWNEIEPQKGEHWDSRYQQDAWAKFDNIVNLAEQHGIRIIARLDQTPAWARPPGTEPNTPPTNHEDFGDFVFEFVNRYEGRISFIQIWNEPNLAHEWGGSIDPAGYASLLEVAARRAREANPDIVILSAPMAMTTEDSARAVDEFSYWQALYDLGISEWFDIMSANVYGLSDPYDAEPGIAVLNTRRVELLRKLAVQNGDGHKAIWFNEFGWNASPADFPSEELIWSRVDEDIQAEWTARGIEFGVEHWKWFGVANIWYFRQVGNIAPDESDYYFRMVDVEFTPRDVYRSVQDLSHDMFVAGPGEHGVLTAPVSPFGSWAIDGENAANGEAAISGSAGSALAIRFRGSSIELEIPPGSSTGSVSVTIHNGETAQETGVRPESIQIDPEGGILNVTHSSLDSPSPVKPGIRTALIQVDDDSKLTVQRVRVRLERSYVKVIAGIGASAVAILGLFGIRAIRTPAK